MSKINFWRSDMRRTVIFGNSGSGKSTFAKQLCADEGGAHLDLDLLAWLPAIDGELPQRMPIKESTQKLTLFMAQEYQWVIEGCYIDLIKVISEQATDIIFMDLTEQACIGNAKSRPWEPHKYESKAAQDTNLTMLFEWISQYYHREDEFSHLSHTSFYNAYKGKKTRIIDNTSKLVDKYFNQ